MLLFSIFSPPNPAGLVGYPSGQRGQTVNLLAYAFTGSNPVPTTIFFDLASRTGRHLPGTRGVVWLGVGVEPLELLRLKCSKEIYVICREHGLVLAAS